MLEEFGAFLRSRRERVRPEDVGIAPDGARRTPGLRREELAELAAISVDYVVRLEQGRLRPSESVLASLSRALLLTPAEEERLVALARPGAARAAWGGGAAARGVRPALLAIVEALDPLPAYVLDACLDVLAFNDAADELFGGLREDANIARLVFTDADYRARLAEPAAVEAEAAGALRLGATREPHNARLHALVDELRVVPAFEALWRSQDVRDKTHGRKGFILPAAGVVELEWERLTVPGGAGLALMVYALSISPGSPRPERDRASANGAFRAGS
ncbi:helix-turn-helix domain-containing protein [Solirubrobacter soli]|uniref:helix-turn-helix domain-containing protein n=1 Tax=Solirubrobacter soli TaxID=363832 RepID=UPI0003F6F8E0|nr:helix-turn-helix domain-containing protein [Solirubrobacter soli]